VALTYYACIFFWFVDLSTANVLLYLCFTHAYSDNNLFRNINDVTAISETEVYVSIWQYYDSGTAMNSIEMFTLRKWTYIVRCLRLQDIGWECKMAADGLVGANGVFPPISL
jgi:hypothetical protein